MQELLVEKDIEENGWITKDESERVGLISSKKLTESSEKFYNGYKAFVNSHTIIYEYDFQEVENYLEPFMKHVGIIKKEMVEVKTSLTSKSKFVEYLNFVTSKSKVGELFWHLFLNIGVMVVFVHYTRCFKLMFSKGNMRTILENTLDGSSLFEKLSRECCRRLLKSLP